MKEVGKIEISQLKLLIAISEEGTILGVAKKLGKSHQTVSKSISKLEKELGVKLFTRTGNEVKQNYAGRIAVSYARSIVNRVERIKNNVKKCEHATNYVSIGTSAEAPALEIQRRCRYMAMDRYKPEKYDLDIEISTDEVMLVTEFGCLNYSIMILEYPLIGKDIVCEKIYSEQLFLAAGKEHALAGKESISISELRGEKILVLNNMDGVQSVVNDMQISGTRIISLDEVAFELLRKKGDCLQLRTRKSIDKSKDSEELVYIPISDPVASKDFYAHYRKGDTSAERIISNAKSAASTKDVLKIGLKEW